MDGMGFLRMSRFGSNFGATERVALSVLAFVLFAVVATACGRESQSGVIGSKTFGPLTFQQTETSFRSTGFRVLHALETRPQRVRYAGLGFLPKHGLRHIGASVRVYRNVAIARDAAREIINGSSKSNLCFGCDVLRVQNVVLVLDDGISAADRRRLRRALQPLGSVTQP